MTDSHPLPDPDSLAEALAYYASYLEFQQKLSRIPGVQAAVYARGAVELSVAFGRADVETDTALTTDHLFRIASHSKTFTATAVFQLLEAGRLRLDDTAGSLVPAVAGGPAAALTVRELLGHSSGLTRDGRDGDFWQLDRAFPDAAELLDVLAEPSATVIDANERFKYSNIAYSLLGLIIEAVTGRSYADVVTSEIVDRLGLASVGPEYDPARADRYATGYSSMQYSQQRRPIDHVDTKAMAAATGFYSTASDLVTYFSAHFRGDDRLLTDASRRQMQHVAWSVGQEDEGRYGLGLAVSKVGDREMIGHGGGYPGHITSSVVDPGAGLAVSVLTNCIDGPAQALAHAGVKIIDRAGAKPRPEPGIDPSRFAGRYASLWGVIDIALLGGRLYEIAPAAVDPTAAVAELEIVDEHTLKVIAGPGYGSFGEHYRFTFGDDGTVRSFRGGSGSTLVPLVDYVLPERISRP
ncbi:serine hydrolase domain-containing protein [Nakamurella panacisegetis]|uniref:serine hydrolase domain-containing protein n=1 Tax=Nakamurella panacisegetis TaxID=1090615 RepID=UPI0018D2F4C7|nr:serine hydrolase domain-containing protein [Nakamurella panacisegetis]